MLDEYQVAFTHVVSIQMRNLTRCSQIGGYVGQPKNIFRIIFRTWQKKYGIDFVFWQ